jgi:hypothetical protein
MNLFLVLIFELMRPDKRTGFKKFLIINLTIENVSNPLVAYAKIFKLIVEMAKDRRFILMIIVKKNSLCCLI